MVRPDRWWSGTGLVGRDPRWLGFGVNARYLFSSAQEYRYDKKKIKIPDDPRYMSNSVPLSRLEAVAGLRFQL